MATGANQAMRVVPIGEDRRDEAGALLGRAFQDDPLLIHACPDTAERARWLRWGFRLGLWTAFRFGLVLGTEGRLDGIAAIIAPGTGALSAEEVAEMGYRRGRARVGAALWDRAQARVLDALAPAETALERAVPGPHWYLDAVAVEPAHRGRGIGGGLLRAAHARTDADGLPIVLLTYQPKTLPLYHRHGYTVACEGMVGSDLRWWGMRREPATRPLLRTS